jgi:hypothetical protein
MMIPNRRLKAKKRLKEPVGMGCLQEVFAAGNPGHTLGCIVDSHSQMIGRRYVAAGYDKIA